MFKSKSDKDAEDREEFMNEGTQRQFEIYVSLYVGKIWAGMIRWTNIFKESYKE